MAGRIVDLNRPDIDLPDSLLLDSSVVIPPFLPMLRSRGPDLATSQVRVASLFAAIVARGTIPFLAAASFVELVHLILRTRFANALHAFPDPASGRPFPSWNRLYKQRPDLVRTYAADIETLRLTLDRANVLVLQPADLGPIPSGRRIEQELIRLVRRYRLDSTDVAILLEARRAGIAAVVSEDPDWRRAARDFDVFTWL